MWMWQQQQANGGGNLLPQIENSNELTAATGLIENENGIGINAKDKTTAEEDEMMILAEGFQSNEIVAGSSSVADL